MSIQMQRLVRRGNVFYFRRRVPKRHLPSFSKGAIVVSLRTKDFTLALVRCAKVNQVTEQLFQMIDDQGELDHAALKAHFQAQLKQALGLDGSAPVPPEPGLTLELVAEKLRNEDGELYDLGLEHVHSQTAFADHRNQIMQRHYPQIGQLVALTWQEFLRQQHHRNDNGQFAPAFDDRFEDALGTKPTAAGSASTSITSDTSSSMPSGPQAATDPSYSLKSVYDGFKNEEGAEWGRRQYKFDEAFRTMSDLYGSDTDIRTITVENAREVKSLLMCKPVRASSQAKFKTLNFRDQVALAKQ